MHFVTLMEDAGDDELKESCLQAFEALALRCFREITPYIKEVCGNSMKQCSRFRHMMTHAPPPLPRDHV